MSRTGRGLLHSWGILVAGLNAKRQRFVEEYLVDLNATKAAIRAGYSPRTANEQGAQLLAILSVADAVARAQAERSARTGLRQDRVLDELAAIAFGNLADFATWDGQSFELRSSDTVDARAVLEVKQKVTYTSTEHSETTKREQGIKLHDKVAALKLLGQHLGMFVEKHDVTVSEGVTVFLPERKAE